MKAHRLAPALAAAGLLAVTLAPVASAVPQYQGPKWDRYHRLQMKLDAEAERASPRADAAVVVPGLAAPVTPIVPVRVSTVAPAEELRELTAAAEAVAPARTYALTGPELVTFRRASRRPHTGYRGGRCAF